AEGSQEVVSNIVGSAVVSVLEHEQGDLATTQETVSRRTGNIKRLGRAGTKVDLLGLSNLLPVSLRMFVIRHGSRLIDPTLDTAAVSNLGVLRAPLDFG